MNHAADQAASSAPSTIRTGMTVFIVDDDASIRDAVANLLETEGIPTRQFGSAEEFIATWRKNMPGCLLLDVRLPGITGVELQEKLRQLSVAIPIVFMTAHGDIPMVRRVIKAGAVEFLTKPFQKEELLDGIQQAFERDTEQRRQGALLDSVLSRYRTLRPRELEVMAQVTEGLLNKQIAANLGLSEITVKLHRRQVMEKMQAASLADLVRLAAMISASVSGSSYTKV